MCDFKVFKRSIDVKLLHTSADVSVPLQIFSLCAVFMKVLLSSSLDSQVFPQRTRERPAEPRPAATPGAVGAAGGAIIHPERLPQWSPVAQPLCAGTDQPAARAV